MRRYIGNHSGKFFSWTNVQLLISVSGTINVPSQFQTKLSRRLFARVFIGTTDGSDDKTENLDLDKPFFLSIIRRYYEIYDKY